MISIMLKANGGFRGNLIRVYFVKDASQYGERGYQLNCFLIYIFVSLVWNDQ